jgi:hypothetical protein
LWFFENTIGELRLVRNVGQTEGEPLDATNWLVFAGCGCMEPASVGYGFKHLALNDWMSFSERYGMPFPIGETTAAVNSPEWQAMEDALDHISNEGSAVIGAGAKIQLLTANGAGEVPMTAIVERMDKAFAVIYRGADLSTLSKGNSQGASVQGNESLIIEAMDCGFVSEVMQQLERRVLDWYDGEGTDALAYGAVKGPNLRDTKTDLAIDEALVRWNVRLGKRDTLERYQREPAAEDEEALESPEPSTKLGAAKAEAETEQQPADEQIADNERKPAAITTAHDAVLADLEPILTALKGVLKGKDKDLLTKLEALDLDALAGEVLRSGNLETALTNLMGETFAEAVNLPEIIDDVLDEQMTEVAVNNDDFEAKHPRGQPDNTGSFVDNPDRPMEKQLYAAEKKFKRTPLFMRAPDGTPTELSKEQWLTVRTPAFIRDHGNWESLAHQQWLQSAAPAAELSGDEYPVMEKSALAKIVAADWKDQHGGHAIHPQIGSVELDERAAKNDVSHGIGAKKAAAFAAVHSVIEKGRIIDLQRDFKGRGYDSYSIAAPVTLAGERHIMTAVVHRDQKTQRHYLHELSAEEDLHGGAFTTSASAESSSPGEPSGTPRGDVQKMMHSIYAVKPESVTVSLNSHGEPVLP